MSTSTRTTTFTIARLDLIKWQIRVALRRCTTVSQRAMQSIELGLDKQWIYKVDIWGFDDKDLCRAQLSIEIDWNEYQVQISKGRVTVAIDGWVDKTAIEVDEAIKLFNKYVEAHGLRTEWSVTYQPHLDRERINKILGFAPMRDFKWARPGESKYLRIPELPEVKVGLRLVG